MKFLDNLIERLIEERIKKVLSNQNAQQEEISNQYERLRLLNRDITQTKEDVLLEIDYLKKEIKSINSKLLSNKDDLEVSMNGLLKYFDEKFDSFGSKKSIITDLLKKIAKLEVKNVSS